MPIARLEVPSSISLDAKRTMMNKIAAAIDEAYDGIATKHGEPILVFFTENRRTTLRFSRQITPGFIRNIRNSLKF